MRVSWEMLIAASLVLIVCVLLYRPVVYLNVAAITAEQTGIALKNLDGRVGKIEQFLTAATQQQAAAAAAAIQPTSTPIIQLTPTTVENASPTGNGPAPDAH